MTAKDKIQGFDGLLEFVRKSRGPDFADYKAPSVMRRVRKRMTALGVTQFGAYRDYLQANPEEFARLFDALLINVTSFFRDEPAWEALAREVLPRIIEASGVATPIRVWTPGCASGEETFTLAMIMAECLGESAFRERVKIYATDLDQDALDRARQAVYTAEDLEPVPAALKGKYFEPAGSRFVFNPEIRRCIIFGLHDLLQDAPISRLDLLVCRNTLMYFKAEAQSRVLARFHFALRDGGGLLLGKAETLLTHSDLFTPVDLKHRLFTKVSRRIPRRRAEAAEQDIEEKGNEALADRGGLLEAAVEASPLAQVVLDESGSLVAANVKARILFNLGTPDLGRPLKDLELSYRPVDLRSPLEKALATGQVVSLRDVDRILPSGEKSVLDIHVIPLRGGKRTIGSSICFFEATDRQRLQGELAAARHELETAIEELNSANEELETTNEELHSTNEELETTNEELHSTNEELETTNEELQSTNQELQALNDELRQRSGDLDRANQLLTSILSCVKLAIAAVDDRLNVIAWNERAREVWGVGAEEALGRPLAALGIGLPTKPLLTAIRSVLSSGRTVELDLDAVNRRGKAFSCHVTITAGRAANAKAREAVLVMEEQPRVQKGAARAAKGKGR